MARRGGHVGHGAARSPGVVVSAAHGRWWSSSFPTGAGGGVQEGGMRTARGRSVAPPLTGGHEAPPPSSGRHRWLLQVAVHVAAAAVAMARVGGQRRWWCRQVGGRRHTPTDSVATTEVSVVRACGCGWKYWVPEHARLLDMIHLIYDDWNWAIVD
jgi:hypothetical protein